MYRYYCVYRPPMIGAVPTHGLVNFHEYDMREYVDAIDREAYGFVEYGEPLSEAKIDQYELFPDPRNPIWEDDEE